MTAISEAAVHDALRTVQEPELGGGLVSRGMVKSIAVDADHVALTIELTTPACPLKDEITDRIRAALTPLGVGAVDMEGASVGLLDADITGPNVPLMMGVEGQPRATADNRIPPLERYGVKVISIQFFVPEGPP